MLDVDRSKDLADLLVALKSCATLRVELTLTRFSDWEARRDSRAFKAYLLANGVNPVVAKVAVVLVTEDDLQSTLRVTTPCK